MKSSGVEEGWGGAHLALIGFGWWLLFAVLSAILSALPRGLVFGIPAAIGGLALIMSGLDLVRGMWVRGARGCAASIALLLVTGYLWLSTGAIP